MTPPTAGDCLTPWLSCCQVPAVALWSSILCVGTSQKNPISRVHSASSPSFGFYLASTLTLCSSLLTTAPSLATETPWASKNVVTTSYATGSVNLLKWILAINVIITASIHWACNCVSDGACTTLGHHYKTPKTGGRKGPKGALKKTDIYFS